MFRKKKKEKENKNKENFGGSCFFYLIEEIYYENKN